MEIVNVPSGCFTPDEKLEPLVACGCIDKDYKGKACECITIKEDIRVFLDVDEILDNIIAGQKKALAIPTKCSKLYDILDVIFPRDLKYHKCKCEPEDGKFISEIMKFSQKKHVPIKCSCPDLLKKRSVLRIIRNYIYQRMKMINRLHYLLLNKNDRIEVLQKKIPIDQRNQPCPSFTTKNISYNENVHRLLRRYQILNDMNEADTPNACLIDKERLMEYIGEHRILPRTLRHILIVEEIAGKIEERARKEETICSDDWKKIRKEKVKCECSEVNQKIAFLENFRKLIAGLNPVIVGEEEDLDCLKYGEEPKSIHELISLREKYQCQIRSELSAKHKERVKILLKINKQLDEEKMLSELIKMLEGTLQVLNDELQVNEEHGKTESNNIKLREEVETLQQLTTVLNKLYSDEEEEVEPETEMMFLRWVNKLLESYLKLQKEYLERVEKNYPGFNVTLFAQEQEKDQIVRDICMDNPENDYGLEDLTEKSENDERRTLRELLKGLTRPHLHFVQGYCPSKGRLVNKLKNFKKKVVRKLNEVAIECQEETIEKEEKMEPSSEVNQALSKSRNYTVLMETKKLEKALRIGRKIASQPDQVIMKQPNAMTRKRLLHELEIKKGLEDRKSGWKAREEIKIMHKKAYETKYIEECSCGKAMEKLNILKREVENIFLQPKKYNIRFLSGPENPVDIVAIKNAKNFFDKYSAIFKKQTPVEDGNFIDELTLKRLTKYDNNPVWEHCGLEGLFSINLEAQMMENERIIIRPQYEKRVKVLSGGRLGLEPLYGEYVSIGMLDGVVLGSRTDGPIPYTILQAILELDSGQGVVIIILNEPEERLSFGFAIERAHKLGVEAELVLARDDVANQQSEELRYGHRGHIGIILQYKLAAGMAMKGYNLAAISRITQSIQIATIGCHFLKYGTYIGSGIREEKGHYVPGLQAEDVLAEMLNQLMDPGGQHFIVPEPDANIVLLINKLLLTGDKIYSIVRAVTNRLVEKGAMVKRVYHGHFCSFPCQGLSITLTKDWNDELIQFLDLPSTCGLWPPHSSGVRNMNVYRTVSYEKPLVGATIPPQYVPVIFDIMDRILGDAAISINSLSLFNKHLSKRMCETVLTIRPNLDLNRLPLENPYLLFQYVGNILQYKFSWIGRLLQLFLLAAAQEFLKDADYIVTWKNWCMALKKGVQALAGYTKFRMGQGTIIDFLEPVTKTLCETKEGWSPLPFLHGGLEKVKNIIEERQDDIGIIILNFVFKNIYESLYKHVSHCKGEEWWKVTSSPEILLVDPDNKIQIFYDEIPGEFKEKIREKEKEWSVYIPALSAVPEIISIERVSEPSTEALPIEETDEYISHRSPGGLSFHEAHVEKTSNDYIHDTEEDMPSH